MNALTLCLRHRIGHDTRKDALSALAAMKRAGRNTGTLRPFRCPVCRLWHVGKRRR